MKKYKLQYLFLIVIIILGFTAEMVFDFLNDEKVNLLIAFIALITAVISMAISDSKPNKLKVMLKVWNRNRQLTIQSALPPAESFSFEIINMSNDQLEGLNISFRFQNKHYHRPHPSVDSNRYFEFGNRLIVQNDILKYLGVTEHDNYVRFEHYLKDIEKWKFGKLAITVGAAGYVPHTFLIDHTEKDDVIDATNDKPKLIKQ